ncbi:peptidoglycan DD-metalloendopeptidase family protein [Ancylomarina sp.]|uniref:peptidoglycan DD-metalloendopeptidase family protein n=1 Tax=Ancylomarina sp. TaxID=1970196 RepID=UPI003566B7A5
MLHQLIQQHNISFSEVIDFEKKSLYQFDFSESNLEITPLVIKDTLSLAKYINQTLKKHSADFGYGGYFENRVIYRKSEHFGGNQEDSRSIHLGTDIWCKVHEPVLSPYNAVVHSFKYNDNFGDYGATIILKHEIEKTAFYTLYGHLSIKSLEGKKVNQKIKQGELFATIGNENENGNWPPHLHFQIITDMLGYFGDFPGVCSLKEKENYSKLCPNPSLILKIQ